MSKSIPQENQPTTTSLNNSKKAEITTNRDSLQQANAFVHGTASFTPPATPLETAAKSINDRPKTSLEISATQLGTNPPLTQLQKNAAQLDKSQSKPSTLQMKDDPLPSSMNTANNSSSNGLPDAVKSQMEGAFNTDFSNVKIHNNSPKAKDIGALAYTQGKDIHFAPGQYNPDSKSGQELIGHELTHVVQQSQGRVKATTQAKGLPVNDDPELEREADEMGRKAASTSEGHTAQRKAAKSLNGTNIDAPIQRFEAPLHESASRNALTANGDFSQDEASMIYYGNWMRDVNQAFVPAAMEMLGADTLYAMLNYVALQKFGKAPTSEQMGYYILAEHLDSPVGAIEGSEYSKTPPKIKAEMENQTYVNPEKASTTPEKYKTAQHSTNPGTSAIPGKSLGIFEVDSTGVMGYIRRTNQHVEKRLQLAAEKGRNEEGFLHFGAAMHAVEDLFAHSNYVEIAAAELLNGELSGIFKDLRDANGKIEIQSFTPDVGVPTGSGKKEKRSVLATGSFSSVDTMESVGHELTHILREPPKAPASLEEIQAQNQFTKKLAQQMDVNLSDPGNQEQIIQSTGIPKSVLVTLNFIGIENIVMLQNSMVEAAWKITPKWTKAITMAVNTFIYNNAMLPLADQIDSLVLETNVADSSMVSVLESNKRVVADEGKMNDYIQPQLNKIDTNGDMRASRLSDAKTRVNTLQSTPEKAVAGPSHSQISKDHKNSVFFGLGFQLAVAADKKIKDKMLKVWGNKKAAISYVDGLEKKRKEDADKNLEEGKHVIEHGYAEGVKPDLTAAKKESADSLRQVSTLLLKLDSAPADVQKYLKDNHELIKATEIIGKNTYITEKLDNIFKVADSSLKIVDKNVRPLDLQNGAKLLKDLANKAEAANSLEAREQVYGHMITMRAQFVKYLISNQNKQGFERNKVSYAAVLTAMDRAIAFNAPSYTSHQKNILEGSEHVKGFSANLQGNLTVNSGFKQSAISTGNTNINELLTTSRQIINHPKENNWWKDTVKGYILSNKDVVKDYIKARNMGFATFRGTDEH
ncbi:DUF4157 domain-containing protein [Fulvivirga sp. 29W222]|uniref:DUF4157 domain-containing protein n=1 Tax=Fulvivirga marina TaxID=2494733 RepID=A0A937FT88_9BACT|nr:DUF4157 domain-containing protein [Fulvivirga marina]MBL6445169.1 DUF4157 domain-containing protein [Fulvivirga marina]